MFTAYWVLQWAKRHFSHREFKNEWECVHGLRGHYLIGVTSFKKSLQTVTRCDDARKLCQVLWGHREARQTASLQDTGTLLVLQDVKSCCHYSSELFIMRKWEIDSLSGKGVDMVLVYKGLPNKTLQTELLKQRNLFSCNTKAWKFMEKIRSHPVTSFNLNYSPKGCVSQNSHT